MGPIIVSFSPFIAFLGSVCSKDIEMHLIDTSKKGRGATLLRARRVSLNPMQEVHRGLPDIRKSPDGLQ